MEKGEMYVRTSFTPIRMVAGQKDSVALGIQVTNKGDMVHNYSVSVKVPFAFGFDKSGLMREHRIRIKKCESATGEGSDVQHIRETWAYAWILRF